MNKYRLTPINLDHPCWAQYRQQNKQPIEVEAEDVDGARSAALAKAGSMQEGESRNPVNPWDDREKVKCELLESASE
jgi:hypothetical protein